MSYSTSQTPTGTPAAHPTNNMQHTQEIESVPPPSYDSPQVQGQTKGQVENEKGHFVQPSQQNIAAPQHQQSYQQNVPSKNTYQTATPLASLQSAPTPVDCPACGVREMTRTEFASGATTHLSALLCCCVLCLGCIPYLASWFKDCEHKCGNCGALLAVWHRSGRTEVMAHARRP